MAFDLLGESRFWMLCDVAWYLNKDTAEVYRLIREGKLVATKIGGRGQWRIATSAVKAYLDEEFAATAEWVRQNPITRTAPQGADVSERQETSPDPDA